MEQEKITFAYDIVNHQMADILIQRAHGANISAWQLLKFVEYSNGSITKMRLYSVKDEKELDQLLEVCKKSQKVKA